MTVDYYKPGGTLCRSDSYSASLFESVIENPAPPSGCTGPAVLSAQFSGSTGNVQAQVNQILNGGASPDASGYPAISPPSPTVVIPYVRNDSTWETGLQIRNTTGSTASVIVDYLYSDGTFAGDSGTKTILANGTFTLHPLPHTRSAVVRSTNGKNIAVVVNHLRTDGTGGDTLMSHIALNQ